MPTYLETYHALQASFDDPTICTPQIINRELGDAPALRSDAVIGRKLEADTTLVATDRGNTLAIAACTTISKYTPEYSVMWEFPANYLHMFEQFTWADEAGQHIAFTHTHLHAGGEGTFLSEYFQMPMPGETWELTGRFHIGAGLKPDRTVPYEQHVATLVSAAQSSAPYAWLGSLRPPSAEWPDIMLVRRTPEQLATQAAWIIEQCRR
jgi:hypothetical protein